MEDRRTPSTSSRRTSATTTRSRRRSRRAAAAYDLITYYQGYKPLYTELDILTTLDTDKIPNIEGLFPVFREADSRNLWIDEDGNWTGVPWTWGSIGITWDDAKLPGGLDSWYDLLDPKFKGKVGVINDPLGAFTLTAHILEKDPSALPKDEYAEIEDFLRKMVAQAKSVAPSFGDMTNQLVAGDIVVCYQGWAYQNSLAAGAGNKTVMTKTPKEGRLLVLRPLRDPVHGRQRRHRPRVDQRGARARHERPRSPSTSSPP